MPPPEPAPEPSLAPDEGPLTRVSVDLSVEGDPLRVAHPVPERRTRPSRVLPLLREVADALVDRALVRAEDAGHPASCARGCTACCSQLVTVGPAEAASLRAAVASLEPAQRAAVEARNAAALARLDAAGVADAVASLHATEPERPHESAAFYDLALRYFGLALACPLLDAEGACVAYAQRPFACREYLVTSPAERCASLGAVKLERLPLDGHVGDAFDRVEARLLPPRATRWLPLPYALRDELAEAPAAHTGPELTQLVLHQLAGREPPRPRAPRPAAKPRKRR